jgi:DNA-binding transcriptional regulator GbsR (MarR family)
MIQIVMPCYRLVDKMVGRFDGVTMPATDKDVANAIGRLMEAYGLKPSVGRCWAMVYLHPERQMGNKEIQEATGLSYAVVSASLQVLKHYHLIEEVPSIGRASRYKALNGIEKVLEKAHENKTSELKHEVFDIIQQMNGDIDEGVKEKASKKFRQLAKIPASD